MSDTTKGILWFLGVIAFIVALTFAANEFEIFGTRFWGVRQENARRDVYEQTNSFVGGKRQELVKYHHEWLNAKDDTDKKAIEFTIRNSFSDFDPELIKDNELRYFLISVMNK